MTKTAQALIWSIEQFQEGRLWTFTVPVEQSPRETAAMWRRLAWELKRQLGFRGIRVFEMHPGGHGLHVHVVTDAWFDVNEVRSISSRMGWGRINVKQIKKGVSEIEVQEGEKTTAFCGNVARYLAKYLVKQMKQRAPELKGLRLWGAFGGLLDHCKVRQVEVVSTVSVLIKLLPCQAVADFWGSHRVATKQKLAYWRMRLAMLIWAGRAPSLDSYLEVALCPCPL